MMQEASKRHCNKVKLLLLSTSALNLKLFARHGPNFLWAELFVIDTVKRK